MQNGLDTLIPASNSLPWGRGRGLEGKSLGSPYLTVPEEYFDIREHDGGVVIEGIKQEYFENNPNAEPLRGYITIPSHINGKPVVEIGHFVFHGMSIMGVRFPPTIASIQDHSFSECRNLSEVHFETVGYPVFCGHEAFSGTRLSGHIPNIIVATPDNAVPFPEGCTFERFSPSSSEVGTVIRETSKEIICKLPIGLAPTTSPSYFPPSKLS